MWNFPRVGVTMRVPYLSSEAPLDAACAWNVCGDGAGNSQGEGRECVFCDGVEG